MEFPRWGAMTRLATISRASSTAPLMMTVSSRMGFPLLRCGGRDRLAHGERQCTVLVVHDRHLPRAQFRPKDHLRQTVLHLALDEPTQGPRPKVRAVPFTGQEVARALGQVQRG